MEILFAGVRGSTPMGGPGYARWGGHSTCVLALGADGDRLLLDTGSGVQHAVAALPPDLDSLTVLSTHLHLDHVLGFPALPLLYRPGARVRVVGVGTDESLHKAFDRLVGQPYWPLGLEDMAAEITFEGVPPEALGPDVVVLREGAISVRGVGLPHPGGSTAWRLDDESSGRSFVLATDAEWSAAGPRRRELFLDLCRSPRSADLLAMDGQYPADELPEREGWGHSSPDQALAIALASDVAALKVVHHAPEHEDDVLDRMDRNLRDMDPRASLAREGERVLLAAEPGSKGPRS